MKKKIQEELENPFLCNWNISEGVHIAPPIPRMQKKAQEEPRSPYSLRGYERREDISLPIDKKRYEQEEERRPSLPQF